MKKVILFAVAVLAGLAFSGIAAACGFDAGAGASLGLVGIGMAANAVQDGKVLTLTAPYTVASGAGAQVGSIFGVATANVTSGAEGEFETEGVFDLAKTSAQAWTVGQKIYWDNSNKRCDSDGTVGILIGVATAVAANPSSTGYVKLNESVADLPEGPQPAIVALTDSTGLSGTHDDTLAATAALVTLTDSTGLSGTHDDTLAATAALVTLTDSTGDSGTHSDTLADGITVGAALVDNSGGEAADGTIAVLVDAGGTATGAPTTASVANALAELAARCNALRTDLVVQNQNDSNIAQKVIEVVAQLAVSNQNTSDVAQKMIEVVAQLVVTNQNVSDVAQKVLELRTALINAGIIAAA